MQKVAQSGCALSKDNFAWECHLLHLTGVYNINWKLETCYSGKKQHKIEKKNK